MSKSAPFTPYISLVIPTYGRPRQLNACLESLTTLDYPATRWELIIVDDGSLESLEEITIPFQERLPLTFIRQENQGPATARNTGAAHAQGEYIAFTDDDCAPASHWLRALAAAWMQTPEEGLGGQVINALPHNPYAAASQALVDYLYGYFNRPGPGGARFLTSNNLAFPTAGFRELGGFDTRYRQAAGEDRGLCDTWVAQGSGLQFVPDAVVYHSHNLSLRSFWRQHRHYGAGAFHFHRLRHRRAEDATGNKVPRLEPNSFYTGLLLHPLRHPGAQGKSPPIVLAALMGLSQLATAVGYFSERGNAQRAASLDTRSSL